MKTLSSAVPVSRFSLSNFLQKLNKLKMRTFAAKITMCLETKDYIIKTAATYEEIKSVHELRRRVFSEEYNLSIDGNEMDFSRYDLIADHIILIHKESNRIAATYRMISSTFSREFYSQTEYDIDDLVNTRCNKVELSRACVAPEFRSGAAIALIWRGLAHYAKLVEARYLFGLSSMLCPNLVTAINLRVKSSSIFEGKSFHIEVQNSHKIPDLSPVSANSMDNIKLPPLLETYIAAGAKIFGEPAYDREFKSLDFFTILDVHHMSEKYYQRYFETKI